MKHKNFQMLSEMQDDLLYLKDFVQILKDTINAHDDIAYLWKFVDLIFDRVCKLYNKLENF